MIEKITKRIGRIIKVRPEYEERYIIIHKHVWPGVLDRIRKSSIRNYSIFLLDGILFSINEYVGYDYDTDMKAVADDITKDWWKLTDPMQEPLPKNKEGEWWTEAEQIQHFAENAKNYSEVKRFAYAAEIKPESESYIKELFNRFDQTFIPLFKKAKIQNHNTFLFGNKLYVYLEYAGFDFAKDDTELNNNSDLDKWNKELERQLKISWKEMKEVFHTD